MRMVAERGSLVAASLALAVGGVLATGLEPTALAVVYLAAVTPWLVRVDLREHRLPNALVAPGIVVGMLGCAVEWHGRGFPATPLIAGVGYAAFLLILHVVGGMGMGDVKLGAVLGLASWTPTVAVLGPLIAFLLGGLVALALVATGHRGERIAFGPYLLGGFWFAVAALALFSRPWLG